MSNIILVLDQQIVNWEKSATTNFVSLQNNYILLNKHLLQISIIKQTLKIIFQSYKHMRSNIQLNKILLNSCIYQNHCI